MDFDSIKKHYPKESEKEVHCLLCLLQFLQAAYSWIILLQQDFIKLASYSNQSFPTVAVNKPLSPVTVSSYTGNANKYP